MSHELHFDVTNGVESPTNNVASPTQPQGGGGGMASALSESAHPFACIFHCLFKFCALFFYIFGGWFASDGHGGVSGANFITVTVICILLLAADFWVVKNITGRLLVGLRWWNKVEGDTTSWIFESAENRIPNKFDNTVFWTVLYITPVVWSGLLFIGILKFELGWLIVVCMALAMSSANVYGYYKCSTDQKAKFQQMMQRGASQGAMTAIRSNLFGILTGSQQAQQSQSSGYV